MVTRRLTDAERKAIEDAIIEHPELSDRKIADMMGTSHMTVRHYRHVKSGEHMIEGLKDAHDRANEIADKMQDQVDGDMERVRQTLLSQLDEAVKNGDRDEARRIADLLHDNAKIRASMVKSSKAIMGRGTTNITQINEGTDYPRLIRLLHKYLNDELFTQFMREYSEGDK